METRNLYICIDIVREENLYLVCNYYFHKYEPKKKMKIENRYIYIYSS